MSRTIYGAPTGDPLGLGYPVSIHPALVAVQANTGAGRTHFYRVIGSGPVSKIGLNILTTGSNMCVAIHANTGAGLNARPGTRLATSGSIATPAIGYTEIALDATINVVHGQHWFSIGSDTITPQFAVCTTTGHLIAGARAYQDVFPVPATPTPIGSQGALAGGASRLVGLIGVP